MEVRIQEKTKIIIEEKWNDFTSREKLQEEEEKKKNKSQYNAGYY